MREAAVGTGLPAVFADRLVARYGELEPWPEAGEVLGRLAEDVPLAVVTNCSEALGQLAAARIAIAFKAMITAEQAGYYKPHPRPYRLALEALGMRPDECLFVAGSAYDLSGAGSVGLRVFWHDRIGMTAPPGSPAPVGRYDTLFPLLPMVLGRSTRRLAAVPRPGGALDRIHSVQQASWCNGDKLEPEAAIGLLVHSFEPQRLLKTDPPRFGRRDEAEILHEEDTLLIDCLGFDPPQFARQRLGERVSEVDRQGSGADGRPIVKLHLVRFARRSNLPPSLQGDNRIDERRMLPRFGNALRVLQGNDISSRLLDNAKTVKLQLTDDRCLPRAGSPGQYEPFHCSAFTLSADGV